MKKIFYIAFVSFLIFGFTVSGKAQHGVIDYYACLAPLPDAKPLSPLIDQSLTDTSITLGGDGYYYMCGSPVENEKAVFSGTITLWKSRDMAEWNIVRKLEFENLAYGAPEIHWIDDAFFMTLGRKNGGCDLLKFDSDDISKSGFRVVNITKEGSDPSIFRDEDGTFYWLYGAGYIGKMKTDPMDGLAGEMKCVITPYPEAAGRNQNAAKQRSVGMRGAFMYKINGYYHLFIGERRLKFNDLGRSGLPGGTDDVFVAVSSKPDEGYEKSYRYLAFPSCGQTTLFRSKDGNLYATYSCTDIRGIFRFKPGAFPVEIVDASIPVWPTGFSGLDQPVSYAPQKIMLRPDRHFIYENGVGLARPVPFDRVPGQERDFTWIRDTNITRGGDGCYYMTGTSGNMDAIHLWKSTDMKEFKYHCEAFRFKTQEAYPGAWYNEKPARLLWAPEIHYINDTYWIVYSVNMGLGMGFLKSVTGNPEGPYVSPYEGNRAFVVPNIDASLFTDSDGSTYFIWQGKYLQKLSKDFSKLEGEKIELLTTDGEQVGYEGIYMVKMDDWYVICAAEWNGGNNRLDGTYDTMYAVSKNLHGPYSPRKILAPHTGHSTLFQDEKGKWYLSFFGNDRTAPFRASAGIMPLKITSSKNDLIIETE